MTNDKTPRRHKDNDLQNFTNAVKTIVDIPKNAVGKPSDDSDSHHHVQEWTCPDCGARIVRHDKHTHEK